MTIVSSIVTGSLALITLGSVVGTLDSGAYVATGLYAYSAVVLWRLWTLRSAHPDAAYALNTRYFLAAEFALRGLACFLFAKPGKSGATFVSHILGPDAAVHPVFVFLALGGLPLALSLLASTGKQRVAGLFVALSAHVLTLMTMFAMYTVNAAAVTSVENAWPLHLAGISSFVGTALTGVSQLINSDMVGSVSALVLTVAGFVGQIPVGGVKNYMLYDVCPALFLLSAALIKSSLKYVEEEEEEKNNEGEKNNEKERNNEGEKNEEIEATVCQTHAAPTMDIEDFFSAPKTKKTPTKKVTATLVKRKQTNNQQN